MLDFLWSCAAEVEPVLVRAAWFVTEKLYKELASIVGSSLRGLLQTETLLWGLPAWRAVGKVALAADCTLAVRWWQKCPAQLRGSLLGGRHYADGQLVSRWIVSREVCLHNAPASTRALQPPLQV